MRKIRKAKEIAVEINEFIRVEEDPKKRGDKVIGIINELLEDIKILAKIRRVQTNTAMLAIFKEVNQRWNAVCRYLPYLQTNIIKDHVLKDIKEKSPDTYKLVLKLWNK